MGKSARDDANGLRQSAPEPLRFAPKSLRILAAKSSRFRDLPVMEHHYLGFRVQGTSKKARLRNAQRPDARECR